MRTLEYDGLTASVIFAASLLGIVLIVREGGVSPIWITNALIVCFVLRKPAEQAPRIIFIGITARVLAGLVAGTDLTATAVLALRDLIEVVIVVITLRRVDAYRDFTNRKTLYWFYIVAGGLAPLCAGLIAAAFLHYARGSDFLRTLIDVYAAHALGMMVIVPVLFTIRSKALVQMFLPDQLAETLRLIGIVIVVIATDISIPGRPLEFLFFPALLLLTFRRSFEGGAIGICLVVSYLTWGTVAGHASYALKGLPLRDQILLSEAFVAVMAFTIVLTGAALEQRRRLERSLSAATIRAESAREEAMAAREEAVAAREGAEKANHMKSMFLATMSHELRTPLNAVIGFSQLLEAETFGPLGSPRYREYADIIEKAGQHLLDLINDILDMSKIEAGKFELSREAVDCNAVVEECADLVSARAKEHEISIAKDLPRTRIGFYADRRAIKQILLNLLSNAIKFTPAGGRVTIRAREQHGSVKLTVTDTGLGIPAEQISQLGSPFVTLRSSVGATQEGTGLGLALARALAQLHGGTLKIESIEGQGTTVTIAIPVENRKPLAA